MTPFLLLRWLLVIQLVWPLLACNPYSEEVRPDFHVRKLAVNDSTCFLQDFEQGSKSAYADGSVWFPNGSWYFRDALTGALAGDSKTGNKSARLRNNGKLTMEFDLMNGVSSISLKYGIYGSDHSSTFEIYYSIDAGITWIKLSQQITADSAKLHSVTLALNISCPVRFEIRKTDGSSNRLNIDDVIVQVASVQSEVVHLTMGNPSNATKDLNQENNYLVTKEEYVLSYSRQKGSANWVSWHLDEEWLGEAPRQNDFRADSSLPDPWFEADQTDYRNTGFDRGHLCPSADRTLSVDDNSNTFLMTNMIPQAPNNNRITWAGLEKYCRTLLAGGNEIYIIAGGYGIGGEGSKGFTEYIAGGKVVVPASTWKVIMVIPDGEDDVNRVTTNTCLIAVDMPNNQSLSSDWTCYQTTVDEIEAKTGYDFFNLVPEHVENIIESYTICP